MKVLVCGSRYYSNYRKVLNHLARTGASLVIAGGARGADSLAVRAAKECGVPYVEYKADWDKYGKSAGPIRNQLMLDMEKPDFVLAFHEDLEKSKGTKDMISRVRRTGVSYHVFT